MTPARVEIPDDEPEEHGQQDRRDVDETKVAPDATCLLLGG